MFVGMISEMSDTEVNWLVEEGVVCSERRSDVIILGTVFEDLPYGD